MISNATESAGPASRPEHDPLDVRLEAVNALRDGAGDGNRGVHLCAQLYLGELRPADVVVITAPEAPQPPSADTHAVTERRMASFQSYRNGRYVFEGWLPSDALEPPREWMIDVRLPSSDPSGYRTILRERIALSQDQAAGTPRPA